MTGYAWVTRQNGEYALSVEIKGYNSRFLEASVFLPAFLSNLEPEIRGKIASRVRRGKIDVSVKLREYAAPVAVTINRAALDAWAEAIKTLSAGFGTGEKPSLDTLLRLEGVFETEKKSDAGNYRAVLLEDALAEALDQFDAGRDREGKHTEDELLGYAATIGALAEKTSARVPEIERIFRETVRARFDEALGGAVDEGRVLAETAALLVKASVAEELSRLSAHLAAFRAEVRENPAPGKKLDFLSQEMNREINTIGSKSPDLEVSRAVVAMKDALENIREQLRNIE